MALEDLEIRALKPTDRIHKRSDKRGLYVEVRPNGSKPWGLKYRFADRVKSLALGAFPEVGLADSSITSSQTNAAIASDRAATI